MLKNQIDTLDLWIILNKGDINLYLNQLILRGKFLMTEKPMATCFNKIVFLWFFFDIYILDGNR